MNPFLLKGYKSPEYFCNRGAETDKILRSVRNQQDITLFAVRRIGKSALLHHVFYHLKGEYDCVYADIWGTTSLAGFINETANAVIQSSVFSKRSIGRKLTDFIKSNLLFSISAYPDVLARITSGFTILLKIYI